MRSGTGGGARKRIRGRRTSLPRCGGYFFFFFFLFFYYTKQSNQQQKNSFSGVSYCRESALQIRAVPPVFTPFIFRGAEWNEKRTPKMGPGCPH
jgi:hypothetical protein